VLWSTQHDAQNLNCNQNISLNRWSQGSIILVQALESSIQGRPIEPPGFDILEVMVAESESGRQIYQLTMMLGCAIHTIEQDHLPSMFERTRLYWFYDKAWC